MPIPGLKPKDLCMIPARVAIALQADGWWLRSDIIWAKPNAMTESVKDRPTKIHEHVLLLTKSERYHYNHEAVKEPQEEAERTRRLRERARGLKTRYDLKRDTQDIGQTPWGKNGVAKSVEARQRLAELGTRNLRSVWTIATQPFRGRHFSTMPEALAERCIKAGSRPGDLVLDPFGGSGTMARVAVRLGRRAVHCDLAYHDLARQTRCTQIQVEAFA
jgi:site-specific DNA-methyltransferase (cytosine-N4-specific)